MGNIGELTEGRNRSRSPRGRRRAVTVVLLALVSLAAAVPAVSAGADTMVIGGGSTGIYREPFYANVNMVQCQSDGDKINVYFNLGDQGRVYSKIWIKDLGSGWTYDMGWMAHDPSRAGIGPDRFVGVRRGNYQVAVRLWYPDGSPYGFNSYYAWVNPYQNLNGNYWLSNIAPTGPTCLIR